MKRDSGEEGDKKPLPESGDDACGVDAGLPPGEEG